MQRDRARQARILAAALAVMALSACVSPPRPVGPTTMMGPLPVLQEGAETKAARAPGATDGPLLILEPHFRWTHTAATESTYEWACTVENPADEGFRVTVVVYLLDRDGRQVASANQAFSIDSRSSLSIGGEGLIEGNLSADLSNWRLEYWVQVNPRPIRDR